MRYSFIVCHLFLISFSLSSLATSRQDTAAQAAVRPSKCSKTSSSLPATKSTSATKKKGPISKLFIEDSSGSEDLSLSAQKRAREAKRNGKRRALMPMDEDGAEAEREGDEVDAAEMEDGEGPSDYSSDPSETNSEYDRAPRVNDTEKDGQPSAVAFKRLPQGILVPLILPSTSRRIHLRPVVEIPTLTQTRKLRSGKRITVNGMSISSSLNLCLL